MTQGLYDLTSNMITQNRVLNSISNDMTNISTPGYKSDQLLQSTFRDELIYRYDRAGKTPVGTVSRINTAGERVTNHDQGNLRETTNPLDFALNGKGFFVIQGENGPVYSRSGTFSLDDQGYLTLQGVGQVLGQNGGPIQLTTDNIYVDQNGYIFSRDGLQYFGQIQVVDFQDYTQLSKVTGGVFQGGGAQVQPTALIEQKMLEDSNVSMVEEMTSMITSQRSLQSSAQILSMYDQLMSRIVQIGSPT